MTVQNHGPNLLTRRRIRAAVALVALGSTTREAALEIGVSHKRLLRIKKVYATYWSAEETRFKNRAAAGLEPDLPNLPAIHVPEEVRRGIQRAAELFAGGMTRAQVAEALKVTEHVLKGWQQRYADTWQVQQALAMNATATLARVKTRPAPVSHEAARQAQRLQRYAEVRGQVSLPHNGGMTLMGFLETVYVPQKLIAASDRSVEEYRSTIRQLCTFAGRTLVVTDLSNELLAGFLGWLLSMGRSPGTCNKHRAGVVALWNLARRRKLVTEEPDVDKVKDYERVPDAWGPDELRRLMKAAALQPGMIEGFPACRWWPALLMTLLDTALRIGAAMRLQRSDLDLTAGWLHVRPEIQKDRAGARIKLHPSTLAAIRQIWRDEPGPLFPWPYDPKHRVWRSLWRAYRKLLKLAGLPCGKRDLFHKLRRTTATNIADALGAAVAQGFLGHSGPGVTRRYLDPSKIRGVQPAEVLPRPWLEPAVAD